MFTTQEIRENFINWFRGNNHKLLKPSKTFTDDPTLFFTTAGMVQLKDIFLGQREWDINYSQLVNCQTCVRSGGKHNDFDVVGTDTYHLTSFEMLGTWSLNNYWKEEAIKMSFEYLCSLGLNPKQMYATYFEGNEKISPDLESKQIWSKYLDSTHIIPGKFKDNFWSAGDFGPCGPCTEIHYDLIGLSEPYKNFIGEYRDVPELVNSDDPNVIEIWNIVMMEYNCVKSDSENNNYIKLAKRFIDTGMGLQRLAMIVQNVKSIYQTDQFARLIKYAEITSKNLSYTNNYDLDCYKDKAFRIFVDHFRTIIITLFDGADFDCNKRGFILRKIFRRLLLNWYLYLNNYEIVLLSEHHIITSLISEILLFHNLKKHDANLIQQKLINEEKLYIGKINKMKNLFKSKSKSKSNSNSKSNSSDTIIQEFINSSKSLKEKFGVDKEIIENIDKIKIFV